MNGSPPDSSVQRIFQAKILEQVAISYFRGCSCPTDQTHVSRTSHINRWILYHCTTWKAPLCLDSLNFIRTIIRAYLFLIKIEWVSMYVAAKSLQSCLTLCDPIDGSPPGSSVPGILQAKILEQVAISYSRGSFWPRDRTCISCVTWTGR